MRILVQAPSANTLGDCCREGRMGAQGRLGLPPRHEGANAVLFKHLGQGFVPATAQRPLLRIADARMAANQNEATNSLRMIKGQPHRQSTTHAVAQNIDGPSRPASDQIGSHATDVYASGTGLAAVSGQQRTAHIWDVTREGLSPGFVGLGEAVESVKHGSIAPIIATGGSGSGAYEQTSVRT